MRLAEPWALAALLLVPLVIFAHFALERRRRARLARAGDPELLAQMTAAAGGDGGGARVARAWLLAAALGLVAVALARPQFGLRTETRRARGMDVVVALDLSRSMLARDVVPSRLERARIELDELIDQLPGDRLGLVGFTSIALPLCPLTIDHSALKLQLRSTGPDDLPRGGTGVGEAIRQAKQMLASAKDTGAAKAILVITDGEDHEGDPEGAARDAKAAGIEVHVAGIGSRTGEPIPILDASGKVDGYVKDGAGQTVISRLDEKNLRAVADAGGGLLALPVGDGGLDLGAVRARLATLKKADLEDRVVRVYEERFQWFLAPGFALLLLATVVRPSRRRRGRRAFALLLAGALLTSGRAEAAGPFEKEDPDVRAGTEALQGGRGEEAAEAYRRAAARLGRDPRLAYNQGLAEVAKGERDAAITQFQTALEAAKDPALRGQAAFALGNTYRELKKWDEAIGAYKRALIEDPRIAGARRNLEIAQRLKAIAAAQPKQENPDGEPDPDQKPDSPDAGPRDGGEDGGASDGGGDEGGADASAGDSGEGEGAADAGAGGDGGQSPPESGDAGASAEDGGNAGESGGEDAGPSGDAAAPQQPEAGKDGAKEELGKQDAEQLLDALQQQEKALQRKKLLEKYRGKTVEKDW